MMAVSGAGMGLVRGACARAADESARRAVKSEGRRAKGEERRAKSEGRRAKGEERRAKGEGRRANEDGEGGFGLEFEGLEVTVTRLDAGEGVCRPVVLDDEVLDAGQAAPSEERLPVH